ncbi:MAG: MmgE/PrpD family protein [Sphingomonadales bacterium]|jgi:2-methylcitrate dehydratase PrpD
MNPVDALCDFAAAPHVLPPEVRADALRLLGDTLAVGAAGNTAPGADAVLALAEGWGSGADARLIGSPQRLPAASAAFVNGFRIHCLEWDAVHEPAVAHALSVVTAALAAAIDRRGGADADEALTALAVGVEIASLLGVAASSPLRFFRPATAGLLGAALAVARLDGLVGPDVLGLAYGQVAGTMQAHVEGSIALPLQVAAAARAAIVAVDMVKAGLTGPHDVLTGPFGYFRLIDTGDPAPHLAGLGRHWRISDVSVKPWPCGRASHAGLSVLAGRADVLAAEFSVPPLVARLVGRPALAGMTPAYGRLCLPFLAALMQRDGRIDPRAFTAAGLADPALLAAAARFTVTVDANPDPNALSPQAARLHHADGSTTQHAIAATLGSPAAPLAAAGMAAKAALCAELAPGADPQLFSQPLQWFTGR